MNEHLMTHLVAARRQDLLAEADRARLARLAGRSGGGTTPMRQERRARSIAFGLRSLLGRRPQAAR
jgi:hypothetical protein